MDAGVISGRRVQEWFASQAEAGGITATKLTIERQGSEYLELSPGERVLFAEWKGKLGAAGVTISDFTPRGGRRLRRSA